MRHSLQFRLMLAFTLVILLTIGVAFLGIWQTTATQIHRFGDRVERMVGGRIQFTVAEYYGSHGSWDGVQQLVSQLGEQFKYRVVLVNAEDKIIADSAGDEAVKTAVAQPDFDKFIRRPIALQSIAPGVIGARVRPLPPIVPSRWPPPGSLPPGLIAPDSPAPEPQEPLAAGTSIIGYVLLQPLSQSEVSLAALQLLYGEIGRYFVMGAALAVIAAVVITLILSRRILSPVRALTNAAHQLGRGDLSQRVDIKDKSEIGELAVTFNSMAGNLERDQQLRREMVADVAHELRSPLTNIRGYLEAIRDRIMSPDEKTVGSIYDETMLLARLIDDLQELTLAEAGELKLYRENEDVPELVRQAVSAEQAKAIEKGLIINVDLPAGMPSVNVDFLRIKQVLLNLLENAIAHTPPGSSVTVAAKEAAGMVEISVTDTGEGIPAAELQKIFERFHRVDKSRSRATGGSGLGLTIARSFVEAHGGTISVQSAPGEGSAFTFTLPVSS